MDNHDTLYMILETINKQNEKLSKLVGDLYNELTEILNNKERLLDYNDIRKLIKMIDEGIKK